MSWILVAVTAVSVGTQVVQGAKANKAKRDEAKQYEENARIARISSDQSEVLRREDWNSTISAIRAIRTARGLSVESPTALAINERIRQQGERGVAADRLNALSQAGNFASAASIARSQGQASLLSGFLKAGTTIAGAYGSYGGGGAAGGSSSVTSAGYSDLPRYG